MKDKDPVIKFIFFASVLFIPLIYVAANLSRTSGLFFPPDEFGYWENAAALRGLDWSGATFMQSYYAKGYSVILLVISYVFRDPVMMYKAALLVNAFVFSLSALALYALCKEISKGRPAKDCVIAATAAFYPAHFVYMNYTIAESLIYLLVTLIFLFLARFERTGRKSYAAASIILSVAVLATHFRTFGILIAVLAMIIFYKKIKNGRSASFVAALVFAVPVIFAVALGCTPFTTGITYFDDQLVRLRETLTFPGLIDLAAGIVGKIFYICVSTFGLFFFFVKRIIRKRKDGITEVSLALSFAISVAVSSVFFVGGKGIDYLVYGRYNEIYAPVMICYALYELTDSERMSVNETLGFSLFAGLSSVILFLYAKRCGINIYMNDFMIGMSWPFGDKLPMLNVLFGVSTLICVIPLWIMRTKKLPKIVIAAAFLAIGIFMSEKCAYHFHDLDRADLEMFKEVEDMYDDGHRVIFIRSPWTNYVGHLQFYMWDKKIDYIEGLDLDAYNTKPDDVIVTYPNYEDPLQFKVRYGASKETPHFILYYNP